MKEGFIVWNMTTYDKGYEFFGVYRTREKAEKRLAQVLRKRYPKMTKEEIDEYEIEHGDCIMLTQYHEIALKEIGKVG